MEYSTTYLAIKAMIEKGVVRMIFPDMRHTLDLLEERELITSTEREDLLKLAQRLHRDAIVEYRVSPERYPPISDRAGKGNQEN